MDWVVVGNDDDGNGMVVCSYRCCLFLLPIPSATKFNQLIYFGSKLRNNVAKLNSQTFLYTNDMHACMLAYTFGTVCVSRCYMTIRNDFIYDYIQTECQEIIKLIEA